MTETNPKTFKEYLISDADRQNIVNALKEEGFSEEQLNAMPAGRVWLLYVESLTETVSREFSEFARIYGRNPQFAPLIDPLIKGINRQLEDLADSPEKELDKKKKDEGVRP